MSWRVRSKPAQQVGEEADGGRGRKGKPEHDVSGVMPYVGVFTHQRRAIDVKPVRPDVGGRPQDVGPEAQVVAGPEGDVAAQGARVLEFRTAAQGGGRKEAPSEGRERKPIGPRMADSAELLLRRDMRERQRREGDGRGCNED